MNTDPIIKKMTEDIVKICDPLQIFLATEVSRFKLCIVVDDSYGSHSDLESEILLKTDCPIPCDIIVYTVSNWNECLDDDFTFAYRIDNEGNLLYEQTKQSHD